MTSDEFAAHGYVPYFRFLIDSSHSSLLYEHFILRNALPAEVADI